MLPGLNAFPSFEFCVVAALQPMPFGSCMSCKPRWYMNNIWGCLKTPTSIKWCFHALSFFCPLIVFASAGFTPSWNNSYCVLIVGYHLTTTSFTSVFRMMRSATGATGAWGAAGGTAGCWLSFSLYSCDFPLQPQFLLFCPSSLFGHSLAKASNWSNMSWWRLVFLRRSLCCRQELVEEFPSFSDPTYMHGAILAAPQQPHCEW